MENFSKHLLKDIIVKLLCIPFFSYANGEISVDTLTPVDTPVVKSGDGGGSGERVTATTQEAHDQSVDAQRKQTEMASRVEAVEPPQKKEEVKDELEKAAVNGKITAKKADEILRKAELEMAQEKLAKMSQASNTSHSTGSTSAPSGKSSGLSHGTHGSSGGTSYGSNTEAYQPKYAPIKKDIERYSNALETYSKFTSGLKLSDNSLSKIQNSFIDVARNTLNMPRGKEKELANNFLFQSLNDATKNSLKESFLGLVKNSAADKAPSSDIPYLKDIVSDTNFQFTAEKILGSENLSYLNLATMSADMLDIKALTGAAYASFLSLTEGTIAGAVASTSVNDWMQAADFLSSKTFLSSMRDAEFSSYMRKGFSELNETYKRLAALKSLDFLDLLENTQKVDMQKILDAGVINAIAALRQAKRLKARASWDSGTLSNFEYFQKHINEALKESATLNSSSQLLIVFDKLLSNNSLRAYWRNFDHPGYFKYRRSIGSIYFSVKFKDFKNFKIAPKSVSDFLYAKVPQDYPKDNAMFFITSSAINYVKSQKERTKKLAEQEKESNKKYSIKQLANDKYYSKLEDEID